MPLYSKSISEIVKAKLNKGKDTEEVEKKPTKKEEAKAERDRVKEEKRMAKEQEKEEKRLAKEAAKEEKKAGKKVKETPAPPPSPENEESVGEGETAVEMEVDQEEEDEVPEPKVKTVKTVKVKKSRKPVVGKKTDVGKPPSWFVKYTREMEAARGITDTEAVKESAQSKWQEKGMPQRVASEREKHVSRMYGMMFGH